MMRALPEGRFLARQRRKFPHLDVAGRVPSATALFLFAAGGEKKRGGGKGRRRVTGDEKPASQIESGAGTMAFDS